MKNDESAAPAAIAAVARANPHVAKVTLVPMDSMEFGFSRLWVSGVGGIGDLIQVGLTFDGYCRLYPPGTESPTEADIIPARFSSMLWMDMSYSFYDVKSQKLHGTSREPIKLNLEN